MSISNQLDGSDLHQVRLNRFVHMEPAALERAIVPVRDELAPRLRTAGCRTVLMGVDVAAGTGTMITFWETAAEMRTGSRAETAVREQALALAGGSLGRGLVDSYDVVLEEHAGAPGDAQWARLARWEGVTRERMREALGRFQQRHLTPLSELPGFCGLLVAVNLTLGNTMSVSLWSSREALEGSLGWERDARVATQALPGMSPRTVIADSYQLVLAPALRQFHAHPSHAREALVN